MQNERICARDKVCGQKDFRFGRSFREDSGVYLA